MRFLQSRDIAVIAMAETKLRRRGDSDALSLSAQVLQSLLAETGLEPGAIDGLTTVTPFSEADHPFWGHKLADGLGLGGRFIQVSPLGGASALANLARAAAAIHIGMCEIVFCVAADAVSTADRSLQTGYRVDYADPVGY